MDLERQILNLQFALDAKPIPIKIGTKIHPLKTHQQWNEDLA
jgi:hypothetical protein